MSPIPVACALIERDGRVLLAQRPAHKHLGLAWEFPGGKVEPGETPEDALIREIREELGCDIELMGALPRSIHRYETVNVEMIPYLARLRPTSPEPQPTEHLALAWTSPESLTAYSLAPADLPIVKAYQAVRP